MDMHLNNRGSILVTTLTIFSIIITLTMTSIGLSYSNNDIFYLEYKEAQMKEVGYGAIEIINSNIVSEVNKVIDETNNSDDFNDYFLNNEFIEAIKDISKIKIPNVKIQIPNRVYIDEQNRIQFEIVSTVNDDVYTKKYSASVTIKNPFLDKTPASDVSNKDTYDKESLNININEIVRIYDYKEI